jgi:hypothetical protein
MDINDELVKIVCSNGLSALENFSILFQRMLSTAYQIAARINP